MSNRLILKKEFRRVFFIVFLFFLSCSKKDKIIIPVIEKEDGIQFSITPNSSNAPIESITDSLNFSINITSKIPSSGIVQTIDLIRVDNQKNVFNLESSIASNTSQIKVGKIELGVSYTLRISLKSKSDPSNQLVNSVSIIRNTNEISFTQINKSTSFYYDYIPNRYYDILAYCLPLIQNVYPGYTTSNAYAQLDYDKDGLLDIVIQSTNYDEVAGDPILVMHNDGGSNYSIKYTFPGLEQGRRAIVNDFDVNGYLDIIIVGTAGERPKVSSTPSQNDPSRYQSPILIRFGGGTPSVTTLSYFKGINHTITSGDINNDGKPDIIAPHFFNDINFSAGFNNGDGTFTKKEIIPGLLVQERTWVELFDINADGYLDIFLAPSGNEKTRVYLGSINGYNSLNKIEFPDIPEYGITYTFQFQDFNSDGKIDIILNRIKHINAPYGNFQIQFLQNNVTNFTDVTSQKVDKPSIALIGDANNPPKWFDYLDQIDIDGDGYRDLVAGRSSYDSRGISGLSPNLPTTYTIPFWLSDRKGNFKGSTKLITR